MFRHTGTTAPRLDNSPCLKAGVSLVINEARSEDFDAIVVYGVNWQKLADREYKWLNAV